MLSFYIHTCFHCLLELSVLGQYHITDTSLFLMWKDLMMVYRKEFSLHELQINFGREVEPPQGAGTGLRAA